MHSRMPHWPAMTRKFWVFRQQMASLGLWVAHRPLSVSEKYGKESQSENSEIVFIRFKAGSSLEVSSKCYLSHVRCSRQGGNDVEI